MFDWDQEKNQPSTKQSSEGPNGESFIEIKSVNVSTFIFSFQASFPCIVTYSPMESQEWLYSTLTEVKI